MVVTQYGVPVDRVLYVNERLGIAKVSMRDHKGRTVERDYFLYELRADGGVDEIVQSAEKRSF
jgi:hypothetical protein